MRPPDKVLASALRFVLSVFSFSVLLSPFFSIQVSAQSSPGVIEVPVNSGTYRTCLQDWPGYHNIGIGGPCSLTQVIQPDFANLPLGTPDDVIIYWDNSGGTVPLELRMQQITWFAPITFGNVFASFSSATGSTHLNPNDFASMRNNNWGIVAFNLAQDIPMNNQKWRIEVVYSGYVPPVTQTGTTVVVDIASGSYRTCLQDWVGSYTIGYSGPCMIQQVVKPFYDDLPNLTPIDVRLTWDNTGGSTPLYFFATQISWGLPINSPTSKLLRTADNPTGIIHIKPSDFDAMKSASEAIVIVNTGGMINMNNQKWKLEVEYSNYTPPTPPAPPYVEIVVPMQKAAYRTCLQDWHPNYTYIGWSGPCYFAHVMQPDYSNLPDSELVDVTLEWDSTDYSAELDFWRVSFLWGVQILSDGSVFETAESSKGITHIRPSTFEMIKAAQQGIYIMPNLGFTPMNVNDWKLTLFYRQPNAAPVVEDITLSDLNEGSILNYTGTFSDTDSSSWTVDIDYGDGTTDTQANISESYTLSHLYVQNGSYPITVTVTDNQGLSTSIAAVQNVVNVSPEASAIALSVSQLAVNSSLSASATFTDGGILDTHTAVWDWGDGTTSAAVITEDNGSGTATGEHSYLSANVYTVTLTITDSDLGNNQVQYNYVVVYNPAVNAGFITASRFFTSEPGWYLNNPSASGQFSVGINAKYTGGMVPTGKVRLNFKNQFTFDSSSLYWLVVTGNKALLSGEGVFNGQSGFKFLISAIDGTDSGTQSYIRVKILDQSNNVVYDSQFGDSDVADPVTLMPVHSIQVHL